MSSVAAPTWHYPEGYADRVERPAAASAQQAGRLQARYDNATTTPDNSRQWSAVDYLSAKAANSFSVRRQLRNRSRYEVANNPYLYGIVNGNADDLIGTGPTLQIQTGDAAYNRAVEASFAEWYAEVDATEKLRTCKLGRTVDGEGFLILKSAASLEHPVKLFPVDVEADQITNSAPTNLTDFWVDGVTLDPVTERPRTYHVLENHPGDYQFFGGDSTKSARVAAENVVHWYPKFRAGQVRGVPVFTPSLDLFIELRAFRRAVVRAAETAADFAAVLEQELGAAYEGTETGDPYQPFSTAPIKRGMFVTLPPRTKLHQMNAAQPATTYEGFQQNCLAEAVRPLAYPLNLALGTSQRFNFSSAQLDHINYRNVLDVERADCERVVLRKLFLAWWYEALLAGAVRPHDGMKPPPFAWHWPGYQPLNPLADAQTDAARIAGGTLTLQEFWAKRGRDYRDVLAQLAVEKNELAKLGLSFGDIVKRTVKRTETETKDGAEEKEPANAA